MRLPLKFSDRDTMMAQESGRPSMLSGGPSRSQLRLPCARRDRPARAELEQAIAASRLSVCKLPAASKAAARF